MYLIKQEEESKMKSEEIRRLVNEYHIKEEEGNRIHLVYRKDQRNLETDLEKIKSGKPEIIEYLRSERAKSEDRKNRIDAIEGLREIEDLQLKWREYNADGDRALEQMMEYGFARRTVKKPEVTVEELFKKHPRAYAYIQAKKQYEKENVQLSMIGKKALERIIYEDDYKAVIDDMEDEIQEFLVEHQWD
jgi:hypothetical protein